MPRIPSGSSSRSSSSKSNAPKPKKPARKTSRKRGSRKTIDSEELEDIQKLSVSQIERIIAGEKRLVATATSIQHSPGEYVRMRKILSILRFDRDKNLAKITGYLTAIHHATDATKREVGWM
jgi:hypothetical protein